MNYGYDRIAFQQRYDVEQITEDSWHSYSGQQTLSIVRKALAERGPGRLLLNAGSGVHRLDLGGWQEISVDLFEQPLKERSMSVRANVEALPFRSGVFEAVVCVGEVLGYCDPRKALAQFARVSTSSGILVFDFQSTRSFRYWFTRGYARAADLLEDEYNGSVEHLWAYDPVYLLRLAEDSGYKVKDIFGFHTVSAAARRFGASPEFGLKLESCFGMRLCKRWADLITVVAELA